LLDTVGLMIRPTSEQPLLEWSHGGTSDSREFHLPRRRTPQSHRRGRITHHACPAGPRLLRCGGIFGHRYASISRSAPVSSARPSTADREFAHASREAERLGCYGNADQWFAAPRDSLARIMHMNTSHRPADRHRIERASPLRPAVTRLKPAIARAGGGDRRIRYSVDAAARPTTVRSALARRGFVPIHDWPRLVRGFFSLMRGTASCSRF